jgi:hypothetical protein
MRARQKSPFSQVIEILPQAKSKVNCFPQKNTRIFQSAHKRVQFKKRQSILRPAAACTAGGNMVSFDRKSV